MQYQIVYKSYEGIDALMKRLSQSGFIMHQGLDFIYGQRHEDKVIGIVIDFEDKTVFQTNITGMACWSNGVKRPLYAEEILEKYDRLITKEDFDYYIALVKEASKDPTRPCGALYRLH